MKRDLYWDSLKTILIFLVILGHTIIIYAPVGGVNQALFNFIYTFHMPLFVFISGMFSQVKDREKYKMGILRVFETYLFFQLIHQIPQWVIECDVTIKSIVSILEFPSFAMWYLLSLAFWRIIVYMSKDIDLHTMVIFVCIIISLFMGFVPIGGQFSFQRTVTFLPFFFMGYYAKDLEIRKYIIRIPYSLALGAMLSLFLFFFFFLNRNIGIAYICRDFYGSKAELPAVLHLAARFVYIIVATVAGIMVMRIVPTRPYLARFGNRTLFIYIYHTFVIAALRSIYKLGYLPQNEWILIFISIIIMVGLIFLSHIQFLTYLLNPISSLLRNRVKYRNN